jgi:hypothetical protein
LNPLSICQIIALILEWHILDVRRVTKRREAVERYWRPFALPRAALSTFTLRRGAHPPQPSLQRLGRILSGLCFSDAAALRPAILITSAHS